MCEVFSARVHLCMPYLRSPRPGLEELVEHVDMFCRFSLKGAEQRGMLAQQCPLVLDVVLDHVLAHCTQPDLRWQVLQAIAEEFRYFEGLIQLGISAGERGHPSELLQAYMDRFPSSELKVETNAQSAKVVIRGKHAAELVLGVVEETGEVVVANHVSEGLLVEWTLVQPADSSENGLNGLRMGEDLWFVATDVSWALRQSNTMPVDAYLRVEDHFIQSGANNLCLSPSGCSQLACAAEWECFCSLSFTTLLNKGVDVHICALLCETFPEYDFPLLYSLLKDFPQFAQLKWLVALRMHDYAQVHASLQAHNSCVSLSIAKLAAFCLDKDTAPLTKKIRLQRAVELCGQPDLDPLIRKNTKSSLLLGLDFIDESTDSRVITQVLQALVQLDAQVWTTATSIEEVFQCSFVAGFVRVKDKPWLMDQDFQQVFEGVGRHDQAFFRAVLEYLVATFVA